MRPSLIPLLLSAVEANMRDFENLRLFECEKVFQKSGDGVDEHYELSLLVHERESSNLYYDMLSELQDICDRLQIPRFELKATTTAPSFAHTGRVSEVMIRGQSV
jgi:phenylalanyl-tRNA synthetase beta subunit